MTIWNSPEEKPKFGWVLGVYRTKKGTNSGWVYFNEYKNSWVAGNGRSIDLIGWKYSDPEM